MDRPEHLALLPLADAEANWLLASVSEESRTKCWWIVLCDGTLVVGDDGGCITLLTEVQLTRQIGLALRALGLSSVIDTLDKLAAHYRGKLSMVVPEGFAPRRYP